MRPNLRYLLILSLSFVLNSCGPQSEVEVAISVTTPCEVTSGGQIPLSLEGNIPEGAQVSWEAETGSFSKTDSYPTTFNAPITDKDLTVMITAKITYRGQVTSLTHPCLIKAGPIIMPTESPDVSPPQTEPSNSVLCLLDLRGDIPSTISCSKGGTLAVQGVGDDAMAPWVGTLSRLAVPPTWRVILYYETWIPPDYKERDPNRQGFVPLSEGDSLLATPGFKVYADMGLTNLVQEATPPDELNDKAQYLLIYPTNDSELVLFENTSPPFGKELHLKYQ